MKRHNSYASKTYDEALVWFRNHGFTLVDVTGPNTDRMILNKYGCSAGIERGEDGDARIYFYPGIVIGGEISKLSDRGYQKFLSTSKVERAATADDLATLHRFAEELKEGIGAVSLYNESMGTVSESYRYDRVKDRDASEASRPVRPWQRR